MTATGIVPRQRIFGSASQSKTSKQNLELPTCKKRMRASDFLSIEPLIAPVGKVCLENIHWVIVGGESGPGARPMKEEWAIDIRNQCVVAHVPFFFKQWGGRTPKTGGRMLDGKTWSQFPAHSNEMRVGA